jgi:hypothetical protein
MPRKTEACRRDWIFMGGGWKRKSRREEAQIIKTEKADGTSLVTSAPTGRADLLS